MNNRTKKIVKLYFTSFICIISYILLENSDLIDVMIERSEKIRYGSFPVFFLTGLFKYGLLMIGIGIILFVSYFIIIEKLKPDSKEKRDLTLLVSYDFGQVEKTITNKATKEIIINTMKSINWNEFHIVQLEDKNADGYTALDVSGSLEEDGLASGLMTNDDHILLVNPLETVEQMTEILLDYLQSEDIWRSKYKYE